MKKLNLTGIALGAVLALSRVGCGTDEVYYDGQTSQGHTRIIKKYIPLDPDGYKVILKTPEGKKYTIYDDNAKNRELGDDLMDWVTIETDRDTIAYILDRVIHNGRVYKRKKDLLEKAVIEEGRRLIETEFNEMYQRALSEAADSIKADVDRIKANLPR